MEFSPPCNRSEGRSRTKSASRVSKLRCCDGSPIPQLSLEVVASSPKIFSPSPVSSTASPKPPYTRPMREILMLSPSPLVRSGPRSREWVEVVDDSALEVSGVRRRLKSRNNPSPRSNRRPKRRLEHDFRDSREVTGEEISIKPRKKKNGYKPKTEKSNPTRANDAYGCDLNVVGEMLHDLIMWKDVSKSSLWFGFGALCLSACYGAGSSFSIFSFLCQMGILFLGLSFLSNSIRPRNTADNETEHSLGEDDLLKVARLILPAANLAVQKARQVFSGEPSSTLKVAPILYMGVQYGHVLTFWRFSALFFFISFTVPKLYSSCSSPISAKARNMISWALDTWGGCSHKKLITASAVTAFWNLASIRTRLFAAFMCCVIVRYNKLHVEEVGVEADEVSQEKQLQAQEENVLETEETELKNQ